MIIYDIEVFKHDWVVVFKDRNTFDVIYNDYEKLKTYMDSIRCAILVGFNNYHYDDIVLAGLLLGKDPYTISTKLIAGDKVKYRLNMMTLDVMQELPLNVGLKSSQANLGLSIIETPIDFNLERKLTEDELKNVIKYCMNDVNDTEKILNIREDYFTSKFEIVQEFNLPIQNVKKTRAVLSSQVLKCIRKDIPNDRLCIDFACCINWDIIPQDIIKFFKQCEYDFKCGSYYKEIENRKIKVMIAGIYHTVAFGGIHGAVEKYYGTGNYLHIDVSSFYPSLIIVYGFMSRKSQDPQLFTKLRDMRYELKAKKIPKQAIYKILINATFGAMKSEYNLLYDPKMANNICINGQIILTQLIMELKSYCELIQSNTDGIIVKYDSCNYDKIVSIVNNFGDRFNLTFDIDRIIKIAQRDVNNYVIQFEDGKIEAKGRFSKFNGGNFMQNSLSIIDKCLVDYYIYHIPVENTIIKAYTNNDLLPFQIVCKMGNTYDGMYYEYDNKLIQTQKVNRVFATNDKRYGGIFKRKGDSYQKIANTSEHNIIHNDDINTFDKSKLDLNYYINLVKNNLY